MALAAFVGMAQLFGRRFFNKHKKNPKGKVFAWLIYAGAAS